jgi:hypothetical protein
VEDLVDVSALQARPVERCRARFHSWSPGDWSLSFLFVLAVGLVAGTISGIVGTGSSIMLMPVLVHQFGPKQAVPIMAVAAVMANLSRILAWWREVDWRACAAYSLPGIPAAARRVPRHGSGEFARALFQQIGDLRAVRRAYARRRAEGLDRRLVADGRRVHRQAFCVAVKAGCVSAGDGRDHDRGGALDAVDGCELISLVGARE